MQQVQGQPGALHAPTQVSLFPFSSPCSGLLTSFLFRGTKATSCMECAKAKSKCEGGSLGRPAGAPRRKSAKTAPRIESDSSEEEGPARKKRKTARSTSGESEGGSMAALVEVLGDIREELATIREELEETRSEARQSAIMLILELRKGRKRAEASEVPEASPVAQDKGKGKEVEKGPEQGKEKEAEKGQEKEKEGDEPMEIAE